MITMRGLSISILAVVTPSLLYAGVLWTDTFDTYSVGDVPVEWTVTAPAGTEVSVTNNVAVSVPNSLRFLKTTGSGGPYPQGIRAFPAVTGGVLRVSYRARTTTSNHDSLYVKLRNAAGQEIGGLRFSTAATIQYQLPNATWTNTGSNYSANVWYSLQIEYDLDQFTYSAWVDGNPLMTNAAFRTNTSTAASIIVQDRVVAGSGSSFLDDVQVEQVELVEPSIVKMAWTSGGMAIEWTAESNRFYTVLTHTALAPVEVWSVVASNLLADGPLAGYTSAVPPAASAFWAVARE